MLKSFQVKDYALIDHIEIEFNKGLNIITGETGAGKSILIDAMGLLLGERASTEVIRKGAQKSYVEGIFSVENNKKVEKILEENEIDYLPELILRREISLKGNNRSFINDTPVSLAVFKEAGNLLVDIHGQHEHQSLLRTETHIDFLDEYAGNEELLKKYGDIYSKISKLYASLKELKDKQSTLQEKKEIYRFQVNEIDAVSPLENEDKEIQNSLNILENSEKLLELSTNLYDILYDGENSVTDMLGKAHSLILELNRIDKSFTDTLGESESALTLIKDISEAVRSYNSKLDVDPESIEELRTRLGSLNMLKKKYGGSLEAVNSFRQKIGEELETAENFNEKIDEIVKEIESLKKDCAVVAKQLNEQRKKISLKAKKEIIEVLKYLGIEKADFNVSIVNQETTDNDALIIDKKKFTYNSKGIDKVEFYISTNAGEDLKPLAKVASGGEISRIMLALKTILAKNDKLPLLIFDEIDTGVSGRIAQKVGQSLKSLSAFHQIISITHLPQIAALADVHFAVAKVTTGDRTSSNVRKLSKEECVNEVAKLLAGDVITEASLISAKELMNG